MNCENNIVLYALLAILLLMFVLSNNRQCRNMMSMEHLENINNNTYNPRNKQQLMNTNVIQDGFVPLPNSADYPWVNSSYTKYGKVDSIMDDMVDMNYALCSKSCCSPQYPTGIPIKPDKYVEEAIKSGKKFVPTSYTCQNNWEDSGCMCMTEKDALFLNRRGMNDVGGN